MNSASVVQGSILQNVVEGEEKEEVFVRSKAVHTLTDKRLGEVESVPCGESEKTDLCVRTEKVSTKQGNTRARVFTYCCVFEDSAWFRESEERLETVGRW